MRSEAGEMRDLPLLPVFTLVLWTVTVGIGVAGLVLRYPQASGEAAKAPPVEARVIQTSLAPEPRPAPAPAPSPAPAPTVAAAPAPAAPPAPEVPQAPQMVAVAAPDPSLSFAVPVAGLTKLVSPAQASGSIPSGPSGLGGGAARASAPPAPPPPPAPVVAELTLGEGEGNQPPPAYPREAVLEHQEGTVKLRFHVDARGKVSEVTVVNPSPWPLLNEAAREAILETWHFPPGKPRIYEVPIQFQLAH